MNTIEHLDDLRDLLDRPGATAVTIVYRAPARLNKTAKRCLGCGEHLRKPTDPCTCTEAGESRKVLPGRSAPGGDLLASAIVAAALHDEALVVTVANPFPDAVKRSHVNGFTGTIYSNSVTRQRLREAEVGDEVEVFAPEERASGRRVPGTPFVETYLLPADIDPKQYKWTLVEIDHDGVATVKRVSYRKVDGERTGVDVLERAPFADLTLREYLEVLPLRTLDSEYLAVDGEEIDPEALRPFLPAPRKGTGSQGTVKRIEVRDYRLDRIEAVTVRGETYLVQLDTLEAESGAA